ncbi:MAG: hypothetical protein QOF76_2398 [Solirubrobacteraceae bacterium]|nr:hypothetical protein [Solirubrobacteraceae bacterium]
MNQFGNAMAIVALGLLVFQKTDDPLAVTGLYVSMEFVPALIAPIVVARVDRYDPRVLLSSFYVLEAAFFGALALVSTSFSLAAILALTFADGVILIVAKGVLRSTIHEVLEPEGTLRQGNALLNVAFAAFLVGGSALSGLLSNAVDAWLPLIVNSITFLVAAGAVASGRSPRSAPAAHEPFWPRFREGLRFVRETRVTRVLIIAEGIAIVAFTLVPPVEVVYASTTLGTSDAGYGALIAIWAAGGVLGGIVFVRLSSSSPTAMIAIATALISLAYIGMAATDHLWIACAVSVVGGLGNGVQWVSVVTLLQESTPAEFQARILVIFEAIASLATGIGFVLGGVVTSVADAPTALAAAGIAGLAVAAGVPLALRQPANAR